jgi:hypothetical protein
LEGPLKTIPEILEFLEKSPPDAVLMDAGGARHAVAAACLVIDRDMAHLPVGQGQ